MKTPKKTSQKSRKYQKPRITPHGKISEVASAFKP